MTLFHLVASSNFGIKYGYELLHEEGDVRKDHVWCMEGAMVLSVDSLHI